MTGRVLPGVGSPPEPRSSELEAALEAARRAGEIALAHLGSQAFEIKADHSIVTAADRECEAAVRSILSARTSIPVLGEESARDEAVRELARLPLAWVVDPIDGTASFAAGLPTFGVSIGLLEAGEPVLGVFYLPRTDELYACDRTGPGWYGSRALLGVLTPETVDERAFLCSTSDAHHFHEVRFPGKVRSLGSTALHVALVARGASYGALLRPRVWDVAAVVPILRRAKGELFDLDSGDPVSFVRWIERGARGADMVACAPETLGILRSFLGKRG